VSEISGEATNTKTADRAHDLPYSRQAR